MPCGLPDPLGLDITNVTLPCDTVILVLLNFNLPDASAERCAVLVPDAAFADGPAASSRTAVSAAAARPTSARTSARRDERRLAMTVLPSRADGRVATRRDASAAESFPRPWADRRAGNRTGRRDRPSISAAESRAARSPEPG